MSRHTVDTTCPVCRTPAKQNPHVMGDYDDLACPACGEFEISRTADVQFTQADGWGQEERNLASAWLRANPQEGRIQSHLMEKLQSVTEPVREEKELLLLKEIYRRSPNAGMSAYIPHCPEWRAIAWCRSNSELGGLLQELVHEGDLRANILDARYELTRTGRERVQGSPESGTQVFIAMNFHPELDEAHQAIRGAIARSGHEPRRVDDDRKAGRIDDQIFQDLSNSRFVVADLTNHRGGVYLEAGFAIARNVPVMFTCRQDQFDSIHFDIRNWQCVSWRDAQQLETELHRAILTNWPHA